MLQKTYSMKQWLHRRENVLKERRDAYVKWMLRAWDLAHSTREKGGVSFQ